jgi:hypothetical protein
VVLDCEEVTHVSLFTWPDAMDALSKHLNM